MLEEKLAELNDQYLRKAADFENFRKRTMREKQELIDFANQNLLLDLLPVIDDFERAIKSAQSSLAAQTSKDFSSFYEGITMIEKRLSSQLENKWGLKRFESVGQPFDPNRHEALQVEKAAGVEEPFVEEDYLKGYTLKDKVIRFAKVKVRMPEEG
jgi:molecular chaperone GrpE